MAVNNYQVKDATAIKKDMAASFKGSVTEKMIERLFFVHFVNFWSRFRVLDATNPLKNSFMTHLLSGSRLKGGSLKTQHGRAPRVSSGFFV